MDAGCPTAVLRLHAKDCAELGAAAESIRRTNSPQEQHHLQGILALAAHMQGA